jgi:hypothetical protein
VNRKAVAGFAFLFAARAAARFGAAVVRHRCTPARS